MTSNSQSGGCGCPQPRLLARSAFVVEGYYSGISFCDYRVLSSFRLGEPVSPLGGDPMGSACSMMRGR